MPHLKFLLAADLHYCKSLAEEIRANHLLLPPDTYDHMRDGRLFWHNEMLVEKMDVMLEALLDLAERERPDLVIFMGDAVNTNWSENVSAVAEKLTLFPAPVQLITGNHDLYLSAPNCRLQDFTSPGDFATGFRYQFFADLGLIFLDLFVKYQNGQFKKWLQVGAGVVGVDYRPEDIDAALKLMDEHPEKRFLVFGHFPMCDPDDRIWQEGRRIGRGWRGGSLVFAKLSQPLTQPNNLIGVLAGHQHFAHWQSFKYGFHWTLPALVEYPCGAAILEVGASEVKGRLVLPDEALTRRSLQNSQQSHQAWPYGREMDQVFVFQDHH